jgi:hypothetical protein
MIKLDGWNCNLKTKMRNNIGFENNKENPGCTKLRNEIETQRTKRNETKYYETQRNIVKGETKRNATKRNLL